MTSESVASKRAFPQGGTDGTHRIARDRVQQRQDHSVTLLRHGVTLGEVAASQEQLLI